jgi:hypothetical protein
MKISDIETQIYLIGLVYQYQFCLGRLNSFSGLNKYEISLVKKLINDIHYHTLLEIKREFRKEDLNISDLSFDFNLNFQVCMSNFFLRFVIFFFLFALQYIH